MTNASTSAVLQQIETRRQQAVEELKGLLAIPSVSANPAHSADCRRCAQWLGDRLKDAGFSVETADTPGQPIVLARNEHRPGRPTVLVYGHYDVQPPDPLDEWKSPPFEPTIRNDDAGYPAIFARGAVDDKGQVWAHIEAIRAWQANGGLPVNLIVLLEGEEEVGSTNLEQFVASRRDDLRADIAVISDTSQFARGVPAITYGLRGLLYVEVTLTAANYDLHSGIFGGAVANPANVLCEMLGSLHDYDGHVTIAEFYDDVLPLTSEERLMWQKLPFDEGAFYKSIGLVEGHGEEGYSAIERRWARPTLDINGLTAGYQGPGAKTIIPAKASAKLSCRLVPNQDPKKILPWLERHLRDRCPPGVKIEFAYHGASPAVLVPHDSPAIRLASEAVEAGFGVKPALIREGGSIPVVGLIKQQLGIDTLLVGFGLPDDRVHSPNEKFDLEALYNGTRTVAMLYGRLAELENADNRG